MPSAERQFVMAARGSFSQATDGLTTPLAVGFARMQTSSGTAGTGLAFISYRPSGVLVTEPGFAAPIPIRSGRIYAEIGGGMRTGVSLANPNSQAAAVSFFFTDAAGTNFGTSSITIAPNTQMATFLNEAPFASLTVSPFQTPVTEARTFTFNSSVPISALAIRGRTNERGDFMMTPVADLAAASTPSAVSIPHIADGGGWTTELLLVNDSDAAETGTLQFVSSAGQSMSVSLDGQTGPPYSYSIPARSSLRFRTAGAGNSAATGWIEILPSGNTRTPSAAAVLAARRSNVVVSETSISAGPAASAFRAYAELSGNYAAKQAGSSQTGVAISNRANSAVNVTLEATNLGGSIVASTVITIQARAQVYLPLGEIPGLALAAPFKGVLWISSPAGSSISVSGLRARYNERQTPDLLVTAYPAFDEAAAGTTGIIFPQVVDSNSYSTQFVLIGARAGPSSGSLQFVSQSGQPLSLKLQ